MCEGGEDDFVRFTNKKMIEICHKFVKESIQNPFISWPTHNPPPGTAHLYHSPTVLATGRCHAM